MPHCGIAARIPKPLTVVNDAAAQDASIRSNSKGDAPSQRNRLLSQHEEGRYVLDHPP
jgi:hypothetical protein